MADPDLTPEQDLRVKTMLSGWGHAFARMAETFAPITPCEFLHARLADGTGITWDEGVVTFTVAGEGANVALAELDREIAEGNA
jgi:hypothetical protein